MPYRNSLVRMAELIRTQKISPVELIEAHLERIEALQPKINAFVRFCTRSKDGCEKCGIGSDA